MHDVETRMAECRQQNAGEESSPEVLFLPFYNVSPASAFRCHDQSGTAKVTDECQERSGGGRSSRGLLRHQSETDKQKHPRNHCMRVLFDKRIVGNRIGVKSKMAVSFREVSQKWYKNIKKLVSHLLQVRLVLTA